jgi:hypothetical protein
MERAWTRSGELRLIWDRDVRLAQPRVVERMSPVLRRRAALRGLARMRKYRPETFQARSTLCDSSALYLRVGHSDECGRFAVTDPNLITTIVVSAVTSGATRVLSAPFEGVADVVKDRIKRRLDNTLEKAQAKAGDRPLAYSDRVAANALNEAAWNDDELTADYLGGVLAASSIEEDEGAAIVAQIGRLSAFQLRLHYVIYREMRRLDPQPRPNLNVSTEAARAGVRIPVVDLAEAMAPATLTGLPGAIAALVREGLLADAWNVGRESPAPVDDPLGFTMQVRPTGLGAELFLWGHGERPTHANRILDPDLSLIMLTTVPETPCATLLSTPITEALTPTSPDTHQVSIDVTDQGASPPEPLTPG